MSKAPIQTQEEKQYQQARVRMVQRQLARRGIRDARVLQAMEEVPRHLFVPPDLRHMAYDDGPLPIGSRQTISQPFIVALMTELLELTPADRVLEIGTGSGYQAAVLSALVREVVSVERIPGLAQEASERLASLGCGNVSVVVGDGSLGFVEKAPYDGILVTAAAPAIPRSLLMQLGLNGRLVIPVGTSFEQVIQRARRRASNDIQIETLTPVRFVPLIGQEGFANDWL